MLWWRALNGCMEATSAGDDQGPVPDSQRISAGPVSSRDPVDQLAEEFVARYRRGERPNVSEYTSKYPELAGQIQEVLQALAILEDLAPGKANAGDGGQPLSRAVPERIGDFQIIREVGRGGMGIVYEAMQESLGRHVALKILPFQPFHGHSQLERFRREARAVAGLHHSNIVP